MDHRIENLQCLQHCGLWMLGKDVHTPGVTPPKCIQRHTQSWKQYIQRHTTTQSPVLLALLPTQTVDKVINEIFVYCVCVYGCVEDMTRFPAGFLAKRGNFSLIPTKPKIPKHKNARGTGKQSLSAGSSCCDSRCHFDSQATRMLFKTFKCKIKTLLLYFVGSELRVFLRSCSERQLFARRCRLAHYLD